MTKQAIQTPSHRDRNHPNIVITGMGIVSVLGETVEAYRQSLESGRSGITRWKRVDEGNYSQIGGDLSDFDLRSYLSRVEGDTPIGLTKRVRKLLRTTPLSGQLTATAALQACTDAKVGTSYDTVETGSTVDSNIQPERFGHIMGGHNLHSPYINKNAAIYQNEPEHIDALYGIMFLDTDVLAVTSELLNLQGPNFLVGGACASGNLALLAAVDSLRAGRADAILVSGAACPIDSVVRQGWAMLSALTIKSFNHSPTEASRPFDARREGFVPSDGAAAVVLETLESAQARGATIYAHLLGAAATCNVSRLPHPDEKAQAQAMQKALADANVEPEQINYVNAHATSTPAGDAAEVAALKTVLGENAYRIPVNATKSLIGHCLTSAAIVELVATVIQMKHGFVHPTINLTDPDPELDLDFVPHEARSHEIEVALSNSFGFGGLNACVVLGNSK